uniref:Putative eukaryotic translation initiation factor 3 subunit n=1 Tax=Schistosoma japonicum TaxID=6182 RepID=C1LFF2_SCHJA|nr:Putative eukaryotic translation initiation factor 3 subunit [Schistosoma japonicum]
MDGFLEIFLRIDKNYDGIITKNELEQFTIENHLDPLMIERWLNLFTEEGTDHITIKKFLAVLGIAKEDFDAKRRNTIQLQTAYFKLGPDIEYIAGDMTLSQQINISNECRTLLNEYGDDNIKLIAKKLKEFLDKTFGKSWHVMILNGSFWSSYSHESDASFHFKLRNYCFNVWKTPDFT